MDGQEPGREGAPTTPAADAGGAGPAAPAPAPQVPPPEKPRGIRSALGAAAVRCLAGPHALWMVVLFGVVAPPVLVLAERSVAGGFVAAVLPLRPFTSLLAWVSAALLAVWLIVGRWLRGRTASAFAGAFGAAACGAAGIGLLMLPVSLAGLLIVIGILGFIPFVTASVFVGASTDALRRAIDGTDLRRVVVFALLGGSVLLGGSWAVGRLAMRLERRYVAQIVEGRESPNARPMLAALWGFPGIRLNALDDAVGDRAKAGDDQGSKRLSDAYFEITGRRPRWDDDY